MTSVATVVELLADITVRNNDRTLDRDGNLVHGQITNNILSSAYRVHSKLGPGLLEKPYRACLCHELRRINLHVETEKLLPVEYDGLIIDLAYRIDILVEDVVVVEVKSIEAILPVHEAQLLSYLKLSKKRVGLLLNFNVAHLRDGIRRRICGY
jgi:GxxExxY protein